MMTVRTGKRKVRKGIWRGEEEDGWIKELNASQKQKTKREKERFRAILAGDDYIWVSFFQL